MARPEFRKMRVYAVRDLMLDCAREIIRREPELRRDMIEIAVDGALSTAHAVLAAHHQSEAIVSSRHG